MPTKPNITLLIYLIQNECKQHLVCIILCHFIS